MEQTRLTYLLQGHLSRSLPKQEQDELEAFISDLKNEEIVSEVLEKLLYLDGRSDQYDPQRFSPVLNDILEKAPAEYTVVSPVHRIHSLRTAWFRYAAVFLICLGAGMYFFYHQPVKPTENTAHVSTAGIAPGGNKAMLTLSDGSTILLDSAASGAVAAQGSTKIIKMADGALTYHAGGPDKEAMYNTITTPRGGQYQIVLPDGTKVWLNAASSVHFPTVFTEAARVVTITGEVYFEVSKNKEKPFVVKTNREAVRVLGTAFNVNSYADEPGVKTSLLEGSVAVNSIILKPGEACLSGRVIKANIEQDLAWKNGVFDFNKLSLEQVMRQISKWYDVEVVYQGAIPRVDFYGKVQRSLNLNDVLEVLSVGVQFRIESGRRLIVSKA